MFGWRTEKAINTADGIQKLQRALQEADTIIIGAGAGLSTSAGFTYSGERFRKYFSDFAEKYGFSDMYAGGFYPYKTLEEHWAYWSRYIWINRYQNPPKPVYDKLYELVREKDYFVLTTNVDHCFQKAGFDKHRLFYTQGDYGLFQCSEPCCQETWDNEESIRNMQLAQGYEISESGELFEPESENPEGFRETGIRGEIPSELVPHCPHCGKPVSMNLRADNTFVEDAGWHRAAERYSEFLRRHKNTRTLFLEIAVGYNTPVIIKYPFWRMTAEWKDAAYACLNNGEACAPDEILDKSILINGDAGSVISKVGEHKI